MIFKRIDRLSVAAVLLLALGISCGSEDEGPSISVDDGRQQQMNALYDQQIVPQQARHLTLTNTLHESAIAFSNTPDASTLNVLKAAWETAFLQWKQMEYYEIGIIKNSFIHSTIHQWPINGAFIEDHIAGEDLLDNDFINTTVPVAKGYGAIEYLLYGDDEPEMLLSFTLNSNSERRMDYLVALTENLHQQAGELQELWEAHEAAFKSRLETGINGSQNQIVNTIVAGLETIKLQKIGQSESSITDASEMEAFYSTMSKAAVENNLLALQATYTGDFFQEEGFGMEEFVEEALDRASLNVFMINAFAKAIAALKAIPTTLEEAVVNNTAELVAFREALTELIKLVKTDLASAANIVVTVNDNDGDTG